MTKFTLPLQQLIDTYRRIMDQSDKRVDGFLLMDSPWLSLIICISYIIFVTIIGPKVMKHREPFRLKEFMLIYNFVMVLLSGYTFLQFGIYGWFGKYSFGCQLVDYSNSYDALMMVRACQLFHLSKYIELIDTVIFILRKKFNQITFLHVFHHGIMPFSWWFGVKFVPGGFGTFHGWLNSWIHFMMYIYYGIAGLGPSFQKYIWWKKYMTTFQLIQFALCMVHTTQLLFIKCSYPKLFAWWIYLYALIFFIMFANFYIKSYKNPKIGNRSHKINGKESTD